MKTRCTESIEYIGAIDAHMVVLAINPLTLSRFYDGGSSKVGSSDHTGTWMKPPPPGSMTR